MKLGKIENENLVIVEVEEEEVEKMLADGYEYVVETDHPEGAESCNYQRISNGWVQVWETSPEGE